MLNVSLSTVTQNSLPAVSDKKTGQDSAFLEMLSNHLEFGLSAMEFASGPEFRTAVNKSQHNNSGLAFKPDEPWERPVFFSNRKPANTDRPANDTVYSDNVQHSEIKEKLEELLDSNPELASVIEQNSVDLQKLAEVLSEFDNSTLNYLSENSDEIAIQIESLLTQLENVNLNEETLDFVKSEKFSEILQKLSQITAGKVQSPEITTNQVSAENLATDSLSITENLTDQLNSPGESEASGQASTFKAMPEPDPKTLSQEISKRLFKAFFVQTETAKSNRPQSFTYSPSVSEDNKSANSSNGNTTQNGEENGFFSGNSPSGFFKAMNNQTAQRSNNVFLSQLIEKAEMLKTSDGKKILNMELDPEELGKMEMELTSKDGVLTAKISAENELAKIRLEELAQQIKEQLNNQGINLTEITVDISSGQPDERSSQQLSGRKNKSSRTANINANSDEKIIRLNILPNLRKMALNIQSVDLTV